MQKTIFKWLEILLAVAGFGLLLWMVQRIGFSKIKEHFLQFGLFPTMALMMTYLIAQICFSLAWVVILPPGSCRFRDIFLAFCAGDAVNLAVPSANLAGEPVKAMFISRSVPMEEAISSVTIYKFSDFVTMTLFLLLGWLTHFFFYSFPVSWNVGAGIVAFGQVLFCILLYFLQKKGVFAPLGNFLDRLGMRRWLAEKLDKAHLIDHGISNFYARHPKKFFASLLFNFLAWIYLLVETMLFLALAGQKVSFIAALTIETFTLLIYNLSFFIPGRLGVSEGARVLFFISVGYDASLGMSYAIFRRLRELLWMAFGFGLILFRKKRVTSP